MHYNTSTINLHCLCAQTAGVKVNDWLLSVNGINVMYKNHETVVGLVKDCEEVTFELTTPNTAQPERNSGET